MYSVTSVNLSPDGTSASASFGENELGEMSATDLLALLEKLRHLDALENHEADAHLLVQGRSGRFLVRTGQGRLFLYNARDALEPYAQLTAEEIIVQLDRTAVTVAPFARRSDAAEATPARAVEKKSASHRATAFGILAAGLALNGYTLYSVTYVDSVRAKPSVKLVSEPAELAQRERELSGLFATGDQRGDRTIRIAPGGRIAFAELGAKGGPGNGIDTFRVGHRGTRLCLATEGSGVIDVMNADTLVYYGDTYKRTAR